MHGACGGRANGRDNGARVRVGLACRRAADANGTSTLPKNLRITPWSLGALGNGKTVARPAPRLVAQAGPEVRLLLEYLQNRMTKAVYRMAYRPEPRPPRRQSMAEFALLILLSGAIVATTRVALRSSPESPTIDSPDVYGGD